MQKYTKFTLEPFTAFEGRLREGLIFALLIYKTVELMERLGEEFLGIYCLADCTKQASYWRSQQAKICFHFYLELK